MHDHPGTHSRRTMRKSGNLCDKKISAFWPSPTSPLGLQPSVMVAALPCCSALGRFRLPLGPWPGVPAPRIPLSARLDLMQGPGALLPPPGARPCKISEVRRPPPGFRASRASVGLGGSPADAPCGKRLRHPALRRRSWTTPLGGRLGRCPRWL